MLSDFSAPLPHWGGGVEGDTVITGPRPREERHPTDWGEGKHPPPPNLVKASV